MAKLGLSKCVKGIILVASTPVKSGDCTGCIGFENKRYPCSILPDCTLKENEQEIIWKRKGSR